MSKISQIYGLEDNNYINMNRAIHNFYDYIIQILNQIIHYY